MAKFYSGINTSVGLGAETLDGMLANGSEFGIFPSQDIDCQGISASGIAHIIGGIKDTSGDMGNSGQVLSSTGSGLNWINPGDANVASASNVGTNDASSTNATHYLAFVSSTSGNNPVRVDTSLSYNPSTNLLSVDGTNGGIVPSGAIIMWSGAANAIPNGYVLCDGNNNTPDLRNRFVVGAGSGSSYSVDDTGGAASVTLATANLPSHSHTVSGTTGDDSHSHTIPSASSIGGGSRVTSQNSTGNTATTTSDTHSHSFSATTSNVGSGTAHENRPPYYALCYIMKS